MNKISTIKLLSLTILLAVSSLLNIANAETVVGQPAPKFSATSSDSKTYNLDDLKGKYVVLEWLNHGCPYVRKHYESGNMQKLQKEFTDKGVVWLSIASSAEGKEGYMTAEQSNLVRTEKKSNASAVILDPEGTIGRSYGAKTTPHMFIINPEGILIYAGAIDDNSSSRQSSIEGAKNYVAEALNEAMSGKTVTEAVTEAYGCSIKYKS